MMRWQRGVATLVAAGIAASGAEALTLRRRVREITIPALPTALDGLTILHISDVHAGNGPGLNLLRRSAAWAAEIEPDIIAVTGDLVARRRSAPGFATACAELVSAARHAALAVLGNHDLAHGRDPFAQGWEAVDLGGLTLLDGAAIEFSLSGHRVSVAGGSARRMLRDPGYDPTVHLDPSAELRLLLCHFPHMLPRLAPGIAHLVLAGHLHGGQLCIPWPGGRIGLAHLRSGPIYALEADNGTVMHISPGIGTTFVPLRFLAQPEVTLLRLRSL
ncbi:MAG TPA: metallophosphoesterase [Gaiellales bacterium]|jgi:predicted MPP superfamily phosphohydrolase|nr:metallophosphoesterase [Gaiellales bacterium]